MNVISRSRDAIPTVYKTKQIMNHSIELDMPEFIYSIVRLIQKHDGIRTKLYNKIIHQKLNRLKNK